MTRADVLLAVIAAGVAYLVIDRNLGSDPDYDEWRAAMDEWKTRVL
jgi:hypothetical protein